MIHSITVTNYLGNILEIDLMRPDKTGLVVTSIEGLGPGKSNINMTEVSTNDGALYNSARLPSRNIVIGFKFYGIDIEKIRQTTYKYFPIKKKITLVIKTDNREAEIEGYVESNEPNIFSNSEGSDISIICPNPYFYSTGEYGNSSTVFSGTEPAFEFPFYNDDLYENLLEFGILKNKSDHVITYQGDAETGVTIKIHALGEAGTITIYNTGTREIMIIDSDKIMAITGSKIVAGDDIIINTVKGQKSIELHRAGYTYNILNCLSKNTDWFQLIKGDNVFAYVADIGSSNLQFTIENRVLYEGL